MRISHFKRFCLVCLSALLLNSCYNDPQFLGNNLIPDDDKYAVKIDTLFELSAYTIQEDSISTFLSSYGMIGYVNSEIFGTTKGGFVGRYLTPESTEGYGGSTAKPDSIFFNFSTTSHYGDSSKVLTINVHELTDTMVLWEPYNALKSVEGHYNPTPLFSFTYKGGKKNLKLPIDTSFARYLMDSTALTKYKLFYTKYKGFYITCNDLLEEGGVAYTVPTSSMSISLYYHYNKIVDGKDSVFNKVKYFSFGGSRFFHYQHDPSKANPTKSIKYLNDTTTQDSVFYVQNLGGVYGKINLNGVSQWVDSMPIIVNKAELLIGKYTPLTSTPDSIAKDITLGFKIDKKWATNQNGNRYIYSGKFRLYSEDYSFNITQHLQRVLEGELNDKSLYVFSSNETGISRVVLQSGSNNSKKMKLRLTYTKLR